MSEFAVLSRRAILAGGLVLPLLPSLVRAAPRSLTFAVYRNGSKIGEHYINFAGEGPTLTATTDAIMTVKLGPVPVFKYHHHAVEHRTDGVFASLETSTNSNGKAEHVEAERTGAGVRVDCSYGKTMLAADANPMTHWNPQVFGGPPLFNPQTGKILKVRTAKLTPGHVAIRGEAEIDDFYDEAGAWQSLTGKLDDGSHIEYRRV
ncbi:DUF6134 family protein [Phenylobacterium sp.]|jgi:hypothetical protein|uniref:DUF6134 family protein n=1 Tax=Phenylobacterium sp. TaxID=1871053 RepID=UPI002E2F13A8|nr:DUF6134 family protein [Phenylobacterium sp.]HEX3365340.1 DUF6134 family protein [Phenylobacterium sp.]